jgi:hypothetical protein
MILVAKRDPMRTVGKHIGLEYTEEIKNLYTRFNRGSLWTFAKLKRNLMYRVQCDIRSKDYASYMNARVTLPNGRTVKEGKITLCIHFLAPLY